MFMRSLRNVFWKYATSSQKIFFHHDRMAEWSDDAPEDLWIENEILSKGW